MAISFQKLIIGADGATSKIRELANIGCQTQDYNQQGLVATIQAENGNANTVWQRYADWPVGIIAYPARSFFNCMVNLASPC